MLDCVIIVLDFVRSFCVICQALKKNKKLSK
nr:MAG TPA: Glutathione peroxidase [Caudoviricetes sp.]